MGDRRRRVRDVAAVMTMIAVVTACSGADTDVRDGDVVTEAGTWSVFDLRVGDCLSPDPELTGEVAEIPVVPCDQPHGQEVVATVLHPDDAYPGADALSQWADGACLGAIEREPLGLTLDDGILVSYLLPTFAGWNQENDRSVVCVLVSDDPGGTTGSYVRPTSTPTASPSPTDGGGA